MINPLVYATVAKLFSKGAIAAPPSMMHAAEPNEFGVMGLLFGLIWQRRKQRLAKLAGRIPTDRPVQEVHQAPVA